MKLKIMDVENKILSPKLLDWYRVNMRSLPWRETNDSYKIWISEVILQQTRVEQGLNYYLKFIERFPTVEALANSEEEEVLKVWQGLGYYSRARNLHKGAQRVLNVYGGKLPDTYEEILTIKGIGAYTAAAILSIVYNKPYAVVDGNVYRVLSRIFGIDVPIDTTKGKKYFAELADQLLDKSDPSTYNQAIMDFGALCCTPYQPLCMSCPFNALCKANELNMQLEFPVKSKKVRVRKRYFNYLCINYKGYTYLHKRVGVDIWKNLYEFPLIESAKKISSSDLINHKSFKSLFKDAEIAVQSVSKEMKHILSHQHIYAKFYVIDVLRSSAVLDERFLKVLHDEVSSYPIPRLIHRYLENY